MSKVVKNIISKKNKASWRKLNNRDVDDYLDLKRQEERIGSFIEKKDEDIFQIDVQSNIQIRQPLTVKQRRKLNAKTSMRSWEGIKNISQVKDPILKRNTVNQIQKREIRPLKDESYQDNIKFKNRNVEECFGFKNFNQDIWTDKDFRDNLPGLKDKSGWVSESLALHILNNVGHKIVKVHDSLRHRTTKAKKISAPHPGMSYNPSEWDHKDLISKVVYIEEEILKKERHLQRVTTKMFKKVPAEQRDMLNVVEMSEGLEENNANSVETDEKKYDIETYKNFNPPVLNIKKSKQVRRKALKQKQLEEKTNTKKATKKQTADINRLKSISKEIDNEQNILKATKNQRKLKTSQKKFQPKRLARLKFQEPDVDISMPKNISGNMRNLKPESSLLIDRFKNFQKLNMLAATTKAAPQKSKKIKRFLRSSHKI